MKTRKFLSVVFVLMFVFGTSAPAFSASSSEITILLHGQAMVLDQPPIIESGHIFVPFRAVFDAFGAEIQWNNPTQTVTAKTGETTIIMQIGNPIMSVNGDDVTLKAAPILRNSCTLVPLDTTYKTLDVDIAWDKGDMTITFGKAGTDWYVLPDDLQQASESENGGLWVRDTFTGGWAFVPN